jgi:hypothetical protein
MAERLRLSKVSRHIVHALGEPRPCLSVDPGRLHERLQHFGQAPAPLLGSLIMMIDSYDGEFIRKLAGLHPMVERRYYQTLGQIPAGAKDYQRCGRRLTARKLHLLARSLSPYSSGNPVLDQLWRTSFGLSFRPSNQTPRPRLGSIFSTRLRRPGR